MVKTKLNRSKLAALCAVMAIVLTQSVRPSLATGFQIDDAFKNLNVKSEAQILDEYAVGLLNLLKRVAVLEARTSVSKAEVAEVTQTADNLKRRSQEVARNVEAIVSKLKAARLFNSLNAFLQARIKDSRALSLLAQGGSITNRLESAAREIRTGAEEFFGKLIGKITFKLQAQQSNSFTNREASASSFSLVTVGYSAATPRKIGFFACVVLGVRLIGKSLNGDDTKDDVNQFIDNCG